MYILTNGTEYVMENPYKEGRFMRTTLKKALQWAKDYKMVDVNTGESKSVPLSKAGIFLGKYKSEYDPELIEKVSKEVESVLAVPRWDSDHLKAIHNTLKEQEQYTESAISDVYHARMDRRPPAHIRTKIDGLLNDLYEKRRDIKRSLVYVETMTEGNNDGWSLSRLQDELRKITDSYKVYRGRTDYYNAALKILDGVKESEVGTDEAAVG